MKEEEKTIAKDRTREEERMINEGKKKEKERTRGEKQTFGTDIVVTISTGDQTHANDRVLDRVHLVDGTAKIAIGSHSTTEDQKRLDLDHAIATVSGIVIVIVITGLIDRETQEKVREIEDHLVTGTQIGLGTEGEGRL